MADYIQPEFVEKRLRFFDGQFLKDQDFIDEQKYYIDRQRRYSRFLNVSGIVDGLTVEPSANLVTVKPGTALDNQGRQVVLGKQVTVALQDYKGQTVDIVIAYNEEASDPQAGSGESTRFYERPYVGTRDKAPNKAADALVLAQLRIDANGTVTVDNNARIASGLRLPDGRSADASKWPALRVDNGAVALTGNLSVTGNVGIGTPIPRGFQVVLPESSKGNAAPGPGVTIAGGPQGNASIELRNNGSGTPYIDFAQDGTKTDFDARIRLTEPGKLAFEGANVGIGTPSPGAKLEVAGNTSLGGTLTVTGASTFTGNVSLGTSSSLSFGNQTRQMINLWSTGYGIGIQSSTQYFRTDKNFAWYKGGSHNDGELSVGGGTVQMVINDGNVGIGITPPNKRLHVEAGELRVRASHNDTTADIGAFFAQNLTQGIGIGYNRIEAIGSNANQDILLIPKGTGNIGIGASSSLSFGSQTRQMINLWSTGYGIGIQSSTQYFRTDKNFAWYKGGSHNDGELNAGTNGTVQMVINDGNVGIGMTPPNDKLDVAGNLRILTGSNPIRFTSAWSGFPDAVTNQAEISNDTGTYKTLMIVGNKSGGNDVRRVSVWDRLRVHGNLYVDGTLAYYWGPDGRWKHIENRASDYAGSYNDPGPSDIRFKTALRPIRDALEKVMQLHGMCYRWGETGLKYFTRNIDSMLSAGPDATEEEDQQLWEAERQKAYEALSGEKIGLVAQDVEPVVPEVVHTDEEGYKYVHYQQLTALLVEAIKEQNALIQALSVKVAALEEV